MSHHRRRTLCVVALTAALLVPGMGPAGAHEHPTPTERAAPGVVYVEARAEVEVSLVEHLLSDPGGVHIRIIQSTSDPVLASASGFVVNPTGAIVTTGAITDTDLERATVYAVNEAFEARYGAQAPMSDDLFTRQQVGAPTDRLQQRLDACYPPHTTNDAGGCVVTVTPTYVVYPHVTSQDEYGRLPAELLPGSTPDVAVLQVRGASGMPTVPLAESTDGAYMLANLGFTRIPDAAGPPQEINAHLVEPGATVLKTADLDEKETKANVDLAAALPAGLRGGPLVAEQGQVIGFLEPEADSGPPPAAPGRLVDARAIREVLSAEGITARRGPVDTSYEAAMHAFKNGGFAASIPPLKAALDLFPGHALAAANLAEAERQVAQGIPGAAPPAGSDPAATEAGAGSTWILVLSVLVAVSLLAAGAVLVLRRRRAAAGGASATATAGAAPKPPGGPREGRRPARSGEGGPAAPSRAATGQRDRQRVPGAATGSPSGAVSIIESVGSVPGQRAADGVGEGSRAGSRAPAAPATVLSSGRLPAAVSAAEDRPVFCTSCGARLGPHHKYCGRCGGAT